MRRWPVRRRLVAFGLGLLVVFGVGFGVGSSGDNIERHPPMREPATTVPMHDHVGTTG